MSRVKSTNPFPEYVRVSEPQKDKLAELVKQAKGKRTVTEFAIQCGVNPSTMSRLLNQKQSGTTTDDLIAAIALNAAPESGVTKEELLKANDMELIYDLNVQILHPITSLLDLLSVPQGNAKLGYIFSNLVTLELVRDGYRVGWAMRSDELDKKMLESIPMH